MLPFSQEGNGGVYIAGEREGQGGAGASEGAQGEKREAGVGEGRGMGWGRRGERDGVGEWWGRGRGGYGRGRGRGGYGRRTGRQRGEAAKGIYTQWERVRGRSSGRRGNTLKRSSNVLSSASRVSNEEWNACARGDRRRAVSIGRARYGCTHDGMAAAGA